MQAAEEWASLAKTIETLTEPSASEADNLSAKAAA